MRHFSKEFISAHADEFAAVFEAWQNPPERKRLIQRLRAIAGLIE